MSERRVSLILALMGDVWRANPTWSAGELLSKAAAAGDHNAISLMAVANLGRVMGGMHLADPLTASDNTIAHGLVALGATKRERHSGWKETGLTKVQRYGDKDEDQQPWAAGDATDETDHEE